MNKGYVLGMGVLVVSVGFGIGAFKKSLTPYVSFEQARKSHAPVQISGKLVKGSARYDDSAEKLLFTLFDEHSGKMDIAYKGVKPGNFEDAISIVAIGTYEHGTLEARQLLVKCPSKYQGAEVEKKYGSDA